MVSRTTWPAQIDVNDTNSYAFTDVPEEDREEVAANFEQFDWYNDVQCLAVVDSKHPSDGKVGQAEFWAMTHERGFRPPIKGERPRGRWVSDPTTRSPWVFDNKQSKSESGASAYARFRDDSGYSVDPTTGKFIANNTTPVTLTSVATDIALTAAKDPFAAWDKLWGSKVKSDCQQDALCQQADAFYDKVATVISAFDDPNELYHAKGGNRDVTGPASDIANRLAANLDKGNEIKDLIKECVQVINPRSADAGLDLSGLTNNDQQAFRAILTKCAPYLNAASPPSSADDLSVKTGCRTFIAAYAVSICYDDGLADEMLENYPLADE